MFNKFASAFAVIRNNRKVSVLTTLAALALIFSLLTSFVVLQLNFVTVLEDGEKIASFTTVQSEKEQLLTTAGITLGVNDKVTEVREGQNISLEIHRAFTVSVHTSYEIVTVTAHHQDTVEDVMTRSGVEYTENDKLSAVLTDTVIPGMEITLVRRSTATVQEVVAVPYDSETKESDTLYKGVRKVGQQGVAGEKTLTYNVVYEDGKEVGRTLVDTAVTKQPTKEIILVGTKKRAAAASSSYGKALSTAELAGARQIHVTATAYCSTSDGGQVTALGVPTGYGIVAVDPSVIPLGSKLYIASADGSYVYGTCVAGDTGGAIKGNRVDLFLGSESECRAFGRRPMVVYVLD